MKNNKYHYDNIDLEHKVICIASNDNPEKKILVQYHINLSGVVNGSPKTVITNISTNHYDCIRFANPYLNAQNDVFTIKIKIGDTNKSVGYIFPSSALIDDQEEEDFIEGKQAFKFYAIKKILENHEWPDGLENFELDRILNKDSCYAIIYKPLLEEKDIKLINCLPSFAKYGYYYFSENSSPNVLTLLKTVENQDEINNILSDHFYTLRKTKRISITDSVTVIDNSPLIRLLYMQLLVEADNPLYRFILLYQIIEYLVNHYFDDAMNDVIVEKDSLSNYQFLQSIKKLYDTRSTINRLFEDVTFEGKSQIVNILRSFILEFDTRYDRQNAGDCLYDIRNLLFHDYKSVLEKQLDNSLTALVIQYEILIHCLIISQGNKTAQAKIPLLNRLFYRQSGIA